MTQDSDVARNVLNLSREAKLGAKDLGLIFGSYAQDTLEETQTSIEKAL